MPIRITNIDDDEFEFATFDNENKITFDPNLLDLETQFGLVLVLKIELENSNGDVGKYPLKIMAQQDLSKIVEPVVLI